MFNIFGLAAHFRRKLTARSDTEHVQAFLRILMSFPHCLYVLSIDQYASPVGALSLPSLILISFSLFFGGITFLGHILIFPDTNHVRRWVGVLHDMVIIGLTIFSLGDSGAPVFAMYIWVVIGNGFRYGIRFLYGAAALALLSFYMVAYFSPFYRYDVGLLVLATFLLGMIIPIYFGGLLKKLQQNLEAAREADRLKTRFLSNVSHDLRTPLSVILANCDLLGREPGNSARQSRRLQDMQDAATTLNGLLVDLLDVARIEAGRIKIISSRFNLIELLGRITRFNSTAAEANGTQLYLTVAPGTPVQVYGDMLRLEQVLNNIVSNAVKYTENGDVTIYARPDIDPDSGDCNGIVCSVIDTGIGMEPEAMSHIFSRFEQADLGYERPYSGAGLGLNIAKELTALMGGSIDVKSVKGEGSCFTLTVPLHADRNVDIDAVSSSCRTPVAVICGNRGRQRYWKEVFASTTLANAQIFRVEDLTDGVEAPIGGCPGFDFIAVDACELGIAIDEASTRADRHFRNPLAPHILVNAPLGSRNAETTASIYKSYRCWTSGATLDDVLKALAIAYWTTGLEPSSRESDEELWSWMSTLRRLTVLIADDNELNRRVLSDMLAYADARVLEVANGADALAILSSEPVDIALLDIQMPDLTGVEVMRAHRDQKVERPVPMIALTADTTEECRADCLNGGASSILHKPVDMKTLYRELNQIVADADPVSALVRRLAADKPTLDLLDYALLHELAETGRQPDYVETLVSCFKQDGEQLLRGLRHAFKLNKIGDGRTLLHRIKGMSGSIGAREMAAVCQKGLTLSDAELSASANSITKALFQLHNDSAVLLDAFADFSVSRS